MESNRRGFLLAMASAASVLAGEDSPAPEPFGDYPKDGMVPNAETAIAIAKAVATARYGPTALSGKPPVRATLVANETIWIVSEDRPPGAFGGGVIVHIARFNGCITHLRKTV